MSAEYPFSTFVGVDIAPLFPSKSPGNAAFVKCNVLNGLPFPDNTFDFVRHGFLMLSINWQEKLVKELIRVTRPGGYIEIMDRDLEYSQPGVIAKRMQDCCKCTRILCLGRL